ncbi:PTS lactose/cellobiose transporter subunit IIA [Halalkalibacterium halodurans]|uniref:PTS system, cellobiose-specific enzyme II, A component (EIIA-cell) n=1 Tax=Halalkalibacterium halodurans (strain ATCC BAA-125 / DSM 18197 / FERM 7344 / JCM 9153 / C-125) TaxID=272558 RepID=Q9KEE2_HALH5|nr:PTS lactose/cellobiose transporter subunit IIA [Halalkalibacterium halodurans]MED4082936.1 PTS lactose/cellobiose transporter subunit IIA [Halalkalibacterium halodurans]MED4086767.1 PTS lactose/cellobiose transporter subunit IIA [Halalkalibacterium halodurans]MED4106297.1 PTS lactose/cellobiose transporter subunit IIA [Halalkalibacterium halodurans]MED4108831.1 PTS lactose/cellobiose transporter subunit IIA [Halalkalibacterium halodurans]MED4125189.1 PTS lactose/cellobiose transporter subun
MPTQQKPLEEIAFQIILHSGNARSCAMEGIQLAKAGKFAAARERMEQADKEFHKAHHAQTSLIQQEASGDAVSPSLLLIHAQDHLMTSMTTKDLCLEIIELHEKVDKECE